jgi:hypothetical protein
MERARGQSRRRCGSHDETGSVGRGEGISRFVYEQGKSLRDIALAAGLDHIEWCSVLKCELGLLWVP